MTNWEIKKSNFVKSVAAKEVDDFYDNEIITFVM